MIPLCSCGGTHFSIECPQAKRAANPLRFLSEKFRKQAKEAWDEGHKEASKAYDLCAAELEKEWMP